MNKSLKIDQFFTDPELSQRCYNFLISYLKDTNEYYSQDADEPFFLEPACGTGNFYYILPEDRRIGYEIDSKLCKQHPDFICADFMKINKLRDLRLPPEAIREVK